MSDIHGIKQVGECLPTAWDDINPPMASARPPEQPSPSLVPATSDQFRNELTACLALVVPVGMTEEARREWLMVAWETLKHLPADILATGCRAARGKCDHPSKIVPTIITETESWMALRHNAARMSSHTYLPAPTRRSVMDRRGEAMSDDDCAELNAILENLGATARYRPDGSRYLIEAS